MNDIEKVSTVSEENQRDVRRMERFECHGQLYGGAADVMIAHHQSHPTCSRVKYLK